MSVAAEAPPAPTTTAQSEHTHTHHTRARAAHARREGFTRPRPVAQCCARPPPRAGRSSAAPPRAQFTTQTTFSTHAAPFSALFLLALRPVAYAQPAWSWTPGATPRKHARRARRARRDQHGKRSPKTMQSATSAVSTAAGGADYPRRVRRSPGAPA